VKIRMYKTLILQVFFYGFEKMCISLRQDNKLKMHENELLRNLFGHKKASCFVLLG